LNKSEYNDALSHVKQLKQRIAKSKDLNVVINVPPPVKTSSTPSAADEIAKLAKLHSEGVLSADEFASLKPELITKWTK
jgi:hypothetical protein